MNASSYHTHPRNEPTNTQSHPKEGLRLQSPPVQTPEQDFPRRRGRELKRECLFSPVVIVERMNE